MMLIEELMLPIMPLAEQAIKEGIDHDTKEAGQLIRAALLLVDNGLTEDAIRALRPLLEQALEEFDETEGEETSH